MTPMSTPTINSDSGIIQDRRDGACSPVRMRKSSIVIRIGSASPVRAAHPRTVP